MGRTREAALDGAVNAVAKYGCRKATMGDIAMLAGIAKATLYNHFRTRDDVYRAAVAAEVERLAAAALERIPDGLQAVLAEAARLITEHQALRRIAADEPAIVARLAVISDAEPWKAARRHVAAALAAGGASAEPGAVDLVVRYFVSQLLSPSGQTERNAAARLLVAAIMSAAPRSDASSGPVTVPVQDARRDS